MGLQAQGGIHQSDKGEKEIVRTSKNSEVWNEVEITWLAVNVRIL